MNQTSPPAAAASWSAELHWFWGEMLRQAPYYRYAGLAALTSNLLAFGTSFFSMVVYDRILPSAAVDSLIALLIGIGIAFALDYLVRQIRSRLLDLAGKNIDEKISERLFKEIVLKSTWKTQGKLGGTASAIRDFDVLKEFFAAATITTFVDIPFAMLFLAAIAFLSGSIVLVPVVAILLLCTLGYLTHIRMRNLSKEMQKISHSKQSLIVECLNGRQTINALGADSFFLKRWNESVTHQSHAGNENKSLSNSATNQVYVITQIAQIAVVSAGVVATSQVGRLVAATILCSRAVAPFSQVVSLLTRLSQAIESYKTLNALISAGESDGPRQAVNAKTAEGTLEFSGLTVSYPGSERELLKDVSFKLAAGETLGILGKTGSGKTTLVRAMLGAVPITAGAVKLGGVDLRDYEPTSLIQRIAVVLQEDFLFSGTIMENICLDEADVNADAITAACEQTGFMEVVSALPEGFRTQVGEKGSRLSGGQRQLLCLTRAIYRQRSHLILDEPTSSLDQFTEMQVVERLRTALQGRTLIFTTHRPAPLALAQKLLVLDQGRVVHFGNRDAVLSQLKAAASNQRVAA